MKTMYKTTRYGIEIEPVEVVKDTPTTVTVVEPNWLSKESEERLYVRSSVDWIYHDTWEQARDCLLSRAENQLTTAKRVLDQAQAKLAAVKQMKKEG